MKRRAFISMIAGAAGGLVLPKWRDPDPVIFLPNDFSTDNLIVRSYERYSASWTDAPGVIGNAPKWDYMWVSPEVVADMEVKGWEKVLPVHVGSRLIGLNLRRPA